MKLISEYMVVEGRERRQLFTIHWGVEGVEGALEFIRGIHSIPFGDVERDSSRVLNSRYLPDNPLAVWAVIDHFGRYRYFYLYSD